jgi:hypothetical protein
VLFVTAGSLACFARSSVVPLDILALVGIISAGTSLLSSSPGAVRLVISPVEALPDPSLRKRWAKTVSLRA